MSNPPPRRALRKAPDSSSTPALPPRPLVTVVPEPAPEPEPEAAREEAPVADPDVPRPSATATLVAGSASDTFLAPEHESARGSKGDKRKHKHKRSSRAGIAVPAKAAKDKTVVVEVPMPKSLRVRLDERAGALGHTREEAVLLLLQAWIDG